jgi:putative ABC transport system substrate-binding protein
LKSPQASIQTASNLSQSQYCRPNDIQDAERTIGQRVHIPNASSENDFERAFATLDQIRAGGLCVQGDTFFNSRREQLVALAAHHSIPTVYAFRDYAAGGGLMSYGTSLQDAYREVGIYAGRIAIHAARQSEKIADKTTFTGLC